jgi:nitroimidazol reductase NimA-like FMN-containing flavoprotein (pyridoxamine 5'-phosphate oxidase superfamily)
MQIEEHSKEMSISLLTKLRFGRLACTKDSQPYVVPIFYAYYDGYIYSFSTLGRKVDWMRSTPSFAYKWRNQDSTGWTA